MSAPAGSVEQRFLRSTIAAYGSQIGRVVIRLAAELALLRLLFPDQHGLFAMVYGAVVLTALVRDFGLPYQAIRDPRQPFGTVLAWSLVSGAGLTLALIAISPLTASYNPEIPWMLRALAPYVLLDALAVTPRIIFERRLEIGRLVAPEIVRGIVYAAVAVGMAVGGFGVESLIVGELAGVAVAAGLLWWITWGKVPLRPDWSIIPDLLRKSRLLFLIGLLAMAVPFVEVWILGLFAGADTVGQFNTGRKWGFKLQIILLPAITRVLYPALVEYKDRAGRFLAAFRIGTLTILAVEVLAAYFLYLNAELVLLKIIAGDQWTEAVPLLKILCFLPLIDPFSRLGGEVLKVRHEDRTWLAVVAINLASLIVFASLLAAKYGATGSAVARFLLLGNLLMTWRIWKIFGQDFWRLCGQLLFVYLAPLPLFFAAGWFFPEASWARFWASIAAGLVAVAIIGGRFQRSFRAFFSGRGSHDHQPATAEAEVLEPTRSDPPRSEEPPP